MRGILLSLGLAVGLLGFAGSASAQFYPAYGGHHRGHHGHHGHHHHGGYHSPGWGGGHYHYIPPRYTYHADPWGGHYHYRPGKAIYHDGPDIIPVYPRSYGGYPGYGYGGGYGYRPGMSFGLTIIR